MGRSRKTKRRRAVPFGDYLTTIKYKDEMSGPLTLDGFTLAGTLGQGGFGDVYMLKAPWGNEYYALKTIQKMRLVEHEKENVNKGLMAAERERDILSRLSHPSIVEFYGTLQDEHCVYLLMDACRGGELNTLIESKTLCSKERTVRFYAAGVVEALDYLHSQGIVFRDLKPHNVVLDDKGYPKLVDFGLATHIGAGTTITLFGTRDYCAPEIIENEPHGMGCDWWSMGVMIFQMVTGDTPFKGRTSEEMADNILLSEPKFPKNISEELRELMRSLLVKQPDYRLGSTRSGGADTIRWHPWFVGFDWDSFRSRKMKAPVKPNLRRWKSNFEGFTLDRTIRPYRGDNEPFAQF